MKTVLLLVLAFILCSFSSLLAEGPPPMTANFYALNPERYLDKPVSLSVGTIEMESLVENKDGTKSVRAHTMNQTADGGWIVLNAKPEIISRIINLCGTHTYHFISAYHPHIIQGTFVKEGTGYAVRIDK